MSFKISTDRRGEIQHGLRGVSLGVSLVAAALHGPVAAQAAPTVEDSSAGPIAPSLVPGLRSQASELRAEAQSQMAKARAANTEMEQRAAERDRWQGQTVEVDRAKALYEKNLADLLAEAQRYGEAKSAFDSRCGAIDPKDGALLADCQAGKARGDAWMNNLNETGARLDQAKADYLQRYDAIAKEVDQLNARISELFSTYMAARGEAARATAIASSIERRLAAAGLSADSPSAAQP